MTPSLGAESGAALPMQNSTNPAAPLLGGVLVNNQDTGQSIDLLQTADRGYAVDIDQLAVIIGVQVHLAGTQLRLSTPLGDAKIAATEIIHRGGANYVSVALLANALASRMRFDPAESALRADLAWSTGDTTNSKVFGTSPHDTETPDIRAPTASLSTIHSEAYFSRQNGSDSLSTLTDLQGALGPGAWRTRILTSEPGGRQSMQNYGWTVDRGNSRVYLGHSQVALDPLLPYANLTGVQYAWSTRPDISYGDSLSNNELIATQTMSGQTLDGHDAPPGGIAELRINGNVAARTAIRLDGTWQFRDIQLRGTEFAEVALYERFGDGAPSRIVSINSASSPRSLPAGTMISYAGMGADGNPLDPAIGTHGMGGFYQMRWGVNDHLTVDAATQYAGGRNYGVANAIMGLGALGTWGFGLAQSGGANAWNVQGNGQRGMWFWNAFAQQFGAGYYPGTDGVQSNRYGELGAHINSRLAISLVGRDVHDSFSGNNYRFLKPAISWRVTDNFNVSARPDYNGSYAYSANWAATQSTQMTLNRYADISQLDVVHSLANGLRLDLAATRDPMLGTRYSQTLSGLWANAHALSWSAGLLEGDGRIGFLLDGAMETIPGLSVHMQAYNDPISRGIGSGTIFQLSLVADFSVTPSGLARGSYSAQLTRRGAISGKVTGELPDDVKLSDLAGVQVLADGRPLGTLDSDGHYLMDNLPPGVYQIQLDSEKLPIDLMPPTQHPYVEVRPGATTRADFALTLQLGFAGRITDSQGRPVAGVYVAAINSQGHTLKTATSDARGYYRVDGLSPGTFTIRVNNNTRTVTLMRRFLFGQDISLDDVIRDRAE